jgi:hypothetical protein
VAKSDRERIHLYITPGSGRASADETVPQHVSQNVHVDVLDRAANVPFRDTR